jgi:nucleotide-binding universal stress UspA family protein
MVPYVDVVCLSFIRSISMIHKIMVAYDESSEAGRALQASIELAKTLGAKLTVVTVLEPLPGYYSFAASVVPTWNWTEKRRVRYSALQAGARQQANASGVVFDAELINGDEVNTIVECAKRHHSDLLVLGMRKHSWLMAGHTSQGVAERAPCAVLGIK